MQRVVPCSNWCASKGNPSSTTSNARTGTGHVEYWKAQCGETRLLRLERGKGCKALPIATAEQLAAWIVQATYEDLSEEARQALKIRVLDALGCAIGALDGPPIRMLRAQLEDFGGTPLVNPDRWWEDCS